MRHYAAARKHQRTLPEKSDFDFEGEIAVAARDVLKRGVQPVANAQNLEDRSRIAMRFVAGADWNGNMWWRYSGGCIVRCRQCRVRWVVRFEQGPKGLKEPLLPTRQQALFCIRTLWFAVNEQPFLNKIEHVLACFKPHSASHEVSQQSDVPAIAAINLTVTMRTTTRR